MRSMIKNGFTQSNSAIIETSHAFDAKDFKIKFANLDIGDDLLKYRNKKLSMKIDVEGHEINTLKGLKKTLKNNKCLLLIEISEKNFNEINRLLKNLFYRCIFKSEYRSDYIYTNLNFNINQFRNVNNIILIFEINDIFYNNELTQYKKSIKVKIEYNFK